MESWNLGENTQNIGIFGITKSKLRLPYEDMLTTIVYMHNDNILCMSITSRYKANVPVITIGKDVWYYIW